MNEFHGRCHCGNMEVIFSTEKAPEDFSPRACQCSFCRKHSTRALSDPAGHISLSAQNPDLLERYRFGTGITDFLVCKTCGVYVAAYMDDGDDAYANVMASVLDDHESFPAAAAPTDYGNEDAAGKRQRRREKWTPASLNVG